MGQRETKQKRDTSLDLLKVMAAFAVVKLHSGFYGFAGAVLQYMCGFAIPIFFMVSGALLLNRPNGMSKNYVIKRMIRILGLMFVWNLIVVVLVMIKNKSVMNPLEYMIQAMFQNGYFWHFWYLWSLLFLTALSPLLHRALASRTMRTVLLMVLLAVCFMFSLVTVYQHGKYQLEIHIPQSLRLWSHLLYFCLGGMIYRFGRTEVLASLIQKHRGFVWIALAMLSVSVALVQYNICGGTTFSSPEYCFTNLVIILYNVLLFIVILSGKTERLSQSPIFRAMSQDSIGIFILHPFVIGIFNRLGIWRLSYPIFDFLLVSVATMLMVEVIRRIPYLKRLVQL